ncbi:hypothetical protein LCGC14_1929290, partial [marine sediment metagenome]
MGSSNLISVGVTLQDLRRAVQKLASNKIGGSSSPTFAGLTITGLTASRLIASNASKALISSDLYSWVTGVANEIDIADDGDGTITIGIVNPLIVDKGGTGTNSLTDHGILLGSGVGAITPLAAAANGQLPIGSVGADPVLAEITGTANQIVSTPGAGSITLSLPQDIHTGASPTFTGATFSGLTASQIVGTTAGKALVSIPVIGNGLTLSGGNLYWAWLGINDLSESPTEDSMMVWNGAGNAVLWEYGATLRTTLGLGTGDSPTFAGGTFTGTVTGIDPTASNHLATKEYVDSAISFINDFFLTDDASIGGYFDAAESPTGAAVGTLTTIDLTEGDDKALDGFITESGFPGVTTLMAGVYNMHFHAQRSAGNRDYAIYFELWTRTDPGGAETLRATSETSTNFDDDNENAINIHATVAADVVINATDRLVWKLFANMGVGNNTNLGILTEGTTNSHVSLPTTTEILSSVFV